MKKSVIIFILTAAAALVFGASFLFRGEDTLDTAIEEYESGSYSESIVILNSLLKKADYEEEEKIHFYRCMAADKLAEEIREDLQDELKNAARENRGSRDYESAVNEISQTIEELNMETGADLRFIEKTGHSSIAPGEGFYNEFISKYRGSRFIEELDFSQLKKIKENEPERLFDSIIRFCRKYSNSSYLPQAVAMIFESLKGGESAEKSDPDFLKKIILNYAYKYPTSQEVSRLYTSSGDRINLRNSPGLDGKVVGTTAKGELLVQIEKSMDTMQIGDSRNYWYRVATLRNLQGWIFGKFLCPIEPEKIVLRDEKETWTVEDFFSSWTDSNTPEMWSHIENGDKKTVSFRKEKDRNILVFSTSGEMETGLFNRHSSAGSFKVLIRARVTSGSPIVLAAVSMDRGKVYYVKAGISEVEANGRSIPVKGTDWHIYELTSDSGNLARLSIDGQLVSARIEPAEGTSFKRRGVYALYTAPGTESSCEVEFIKIK